MSGRALNECCLTATLAGATQAEPDGFDILRALSPISLKSVKSILKQ
ncbi:MAG: hypothetical protein AB7Q81_24700 [Gammaproteobacteria bacterium]